MIAKKKGKKNSHSTRLADKKRREAGMRGDYARMLRLINNTFPDLCISSEPVLHSLYNTEFQWISETSHKHDTTSLHSHCTLSASRE